MSDREFDKHERIIRRICRALDFPGYGKVRDAGRICYTVTDIKALPVRLVEIKIHTSERKKLEDYAFPLESWNTGLARAEIFCCPFVLAVQWSDFLGVISTKFLTEPDMVDDETAFFNVRKFRAVKNGV